MHKIVVNNSEWEVKDDNDSFPPHGANFTAQNTESCEMWCDNYGTMGRWSYEGKLLET